MEQWLGVEVRHFAALAAIDEERSFRGAADRLGYVQSAVSQQIARLERMVGVRLVERVRGHPRVELSEAGKLLLAHAERVLAQLQAAQTDLQALSGGAGRTLRVGAFPSVVTRIMPVALARLAEEEPDLEVRMTEARTEGELFGALERGDIDAAFTELPLEPGPFEARELVSDPFALVVPRSWPLARGSAPATLAQIAAVPLVGQIGWRMSELIAKIFGAAGLEIEYRFQSDTCAGRQAYVAAGLAAAIMPRLAVDEHDPAVAVVDLGDVLPARTIALCWNRERIHGPALAAFVHVVEKSCANLLAVPESVNVVVVDPRANGRAPEQAAA